MVHPLRGDDLVTCPHRLVLERTGVPRDDVEESAEIAYRRSKAEEMRARVLTRLEDLGARRVRGRSDTLTALERGIEIILSPVLPDDVPGRRRAQSHALVRVGRRDDTYLYSPLLIRNIEFTDPSPTRFLDVSSLEGLTSRETTREGATPRSGPSIARSVVSLAHATRVLEGLGVADTLARVILVDRHERAWWWSLNVPPGSRLSWSAYDTAYEERRALLDALEEALPEPVSEPYWHRECPDCPFQSRCREELLARDDVSLVQFTSRAHQDLFHHFGVHTRADLAALDPSRCDGPATRGEDPPVEHLLADTVEHVGDLIYRARSALSGGPLRKVAPELLQCPRGEVEVDVDMESCEDRTYLWGARIRLARPVEGVVEGYVSVVSWDPLTAEVEAEVFARFWRWFDSVRHHAERAGATFRAYCFWAQAEDGAMNRALNTLSDPALRARVEHFRRRETGEWIDLHEVVSHQIQTDGPTGLKKLARAAGFDWRDESPSGEASLLWYRHATSDEPDAPRWRERLLAYNEDDCAATAALRDWLNGDARHLPSRDVWPPQ